MLKHTDGGDRQTKAPTERVDSQAWLMDENSFLMLCLQTQDGEHFRDACPPFAWCILLR